MTASIIKDERLRQPLMVRPALVKLGGSVVTDKAKAASFHRATTKRLIAEIAKSAVPTVLFHGAGSFGHPHVLKHGIGQRPADDRMRAGVSAALAGVGRLQADIVAVAQTAGLRPVAVPLHLTATSEGDALVDLPVGKVQRLIAEGHTPVMGGTLVRDAELGWRVVSADDLMAVFAEDLGPRLALFVTNVDGVFDRHPDAPGATFLDHVPDLELADRVAAFEEGDDADATGRMRGKLWRAMAIAEQCPTKIVNGGVRGRLLDALRGKPVLATRIGRV